MYNYAHWLCLGPDTEEKYRKAPTFQEFIRFLVDLPVRQYWDDDNYYQWLASCLSMTPTGDRCSYNVCPVTSPTEWWLVLRASPLTASTSSRPSGSTPGYPCLTRRGPVTPAASRLSITQKLVNFAKYFASSLLHYRREAARETLQHL